jgi:hypothetical protein
LSWHFFQANEPLKRALFLSGVDTMMQKRVFQAARFLSSRLNHCLPSLEFNLLSIIEEVGILWKMNGSRKSSLFQTKLLRLDIGVVPCEGIQAEITGLPAVVRVGPPMELGRERGKVCDEQ